MLVSTTAFERAPRDTLSTGRHKSMDGTGRWLVAGLPLLLCMLGCVGSDTAGVFSHRGNTETFSGIWSSDKWIQEFKSTYDVEKGVEDGTQRCERAMVTIDVNGGTRIVSETVRIKAISRVPIFGQARLEIHMNGEVIASENEDELTVSVENKVTSWNTFEAFLILDETPATVHSYNYHVVSGGSGHDMTTYGSVCSEVAVLMIPRAVRSRYSVQAWCDAPWTAPHNLLVMANLVANDEHLWAALRESDLVSRRLDKYGSPCTVVGRARAPFRYPPHVVADLEERWYDYESILRRTGWSVNLTYIPILWHEHFHSWAHGKRQCPRRDSIQPEVDLKFSDARIRYFTISQSDNGLYSGPNKGYEETFHAMLPSNVLVFGANGWGDVVVPLASDPHISENSHAPAIEKLWLASFVGRITNQIRVWLDELYTEMPGFMIVSQDFMMSSNFSDGFRELVSTSVFSLCPEGNGPASFRPFEAMQLGSVPVLISAGETMNTIHGSSDGEEFWLPHPPGDTQWSDFAVLVRRSEILLLPEILLSFSPCDISRMRKLGKLVYEASFSMPATLRGIRSAVEQIEEVWRREEDGTFGSPPQQQMEQVPYATDTALERLSKACGPTPLLTSCPDEQKYALGKLLLIKSIQTPTERMFLCSRAIAYLAGSVTDLDGENTRETEADRAQRAVWANIYAQSLYVCAGENATSLAVKWLIIAKRAGLPDVPFLQTIELMYGINNDDVHRLLLLGGTTYSTIYNILKERQKEALTFQGIVVFLSPHCE